MSHLKLHKDIEKFFESGAENASADFVRDELHINDDHDARNYFFHVAGQHGKDWFDWIDKNELFTELKKNEKKAKKSKVHATELGYLTDMVEKYPEGVTRVIGAKDNATTEENFNPAVVGRFLWIISKLPAEQIAELTKKILEKGWIKNRGAFNRTGYEFTEMVEKLAEANEHNALLELAQAILSVKEVDEREAIDVEGRAVYTGSTFYLSDISQSGIFQELIAIEGEKQEDVVDVLSTILKKVIENSGRESSGDFFEYSDSASFYDENLFSLEMKDRSAYGSDIDLKNLVVALLHSVRLIIENECDQDKEKVREIVGLLPGKNMSRLIWRLHLTVLSECPKVFSTELEEMFFTLFDPSLENYYDVQGGPEYEEALKRSFEVIEKKGEYLEKVFRFFEEKAEQNPDQKWHKRIGWEVLSSVQEFLAEEDKEKCKEIFGARPDENYQPESRVSRITGGRVQHRSPIDISEIDSIEEIFENIKENWTPKKLEEEYKDDDFLRPRGVEGLGDALKDDLKVRLGEYLKALIEEEELEEFTPHYVYSMMRGLEDMSREGQKWNDDEIDQLLEVFTKISDLSFEKSLFDIDVGQENSWLADWTTVHKPIVDTLLYVVQQKNIKEYISDEKRRTSGYTLFEYVLRVDDPKPESEDPKYGDLYHIAINSVRGRAFETFTIFIEKEGDILSDEAKKLYKEVLKDNSLAVRFVVGRYLASYYFRDKEFIGNLLSEVFPKDDAGEKELFFAAWGGYLSNSLYNQLFEEMKPYYRCAISLTEEDYPKKREYISDHSLDKALAIHMALAFAHLGEDYEKDSVVAEFWQKDNAERFAEFISFIGRSLLNRDKASKDYLREQKVELDRLVAFWEWVLEEKSDLGPKIFGGFGFWVNPEKEIIPDEKLISLVAETLKKSKGSCDWEVGLMKRLPKWAERENTGAVLEIVRNYLLSDKELNEENRYPLIYNDEIKKALSIVYNNGDKKTKKDVTALIDDLIGAGSQIFWELKDVVK